MSTKTSTYPLRLPVSLKAALEKLGKEDGTSINQFVVTAIAEKIAVLKTGRSLVYECHLSAIQTANRA